MQGTICCYETRECPNTLATTAECPKLRFWAGGFPLPFKPAVGQGVVRFASRGAEGPAWHVPAIAQTPPGRFTQRQGLGPPVKRTVDRRHWQDSGAGPSAWPDGCGTEAGEGTGKAHLRVRPEGPQVTLQISAGHELHDDQRGLALRHHAKEPHLRGNRGSVIPSSQALSSSWARRRLMLEAWVCKWRCFQADWGVPLN